MSTPMRGNFLLHARMRQSESAARLWRQRQRLAGVTGTCTSAAARCTTKALSAALARPCPTYLDAITPLPLPLPPPSLSRQHPLSLPVRPVTPSAAAAAGLALYAGDPKPCTFLSARLSLAPTQTHYYYTIRIPPLPPPCKTEPQVSTPACASNLSANSSANSSANFSASSSADPSFTLLKNSSQPQIQSLPFHQPGSVRHFSTTSPAMTAIKLDGTAIAKSIREKLAAEIVEKQKVNPQYQPCLKIIQGPSRTTIPINR